MSMEEFDKVVGSEDSASILQVQHRGQSWSWAETACNSN